MGTIVLSCGLMFPQLHWMYLWERLAERYRVVVFEHGSHGLNTKLNDCPGLQSSDAAEEWVIAYWTGVISKLDLPKKFHCSACAIQACKSHFTQARNLSA